MATMVTLPNGHFGLSSDTVYWFPIEDEDVNGKVVAAPPGDVVTAVTTGAHAASLAAAVGTMPPDAPNPGVPAVSLTPMVAQSDDGNGGGGIGLTLTDTANLTEDSATMNALFDIVAPPDVATQVGVDFPGVFTTSQPVPSAPGP